MVYLLTRAQGPAGLEPRCSWGTFTRHLEIGDDRYVLRHVDLFENGYAVRYDRVHWVDDLGMLADMPYCPRAWEKWWGPAISLRAVEFEWVWTTVESSPARPLQLATAKMGRWGVVPPWLVRRGNAKPGATPDCGSG